MPDRDVTTIRDLIYYTASGCVPKVVYLFTVVPATTQEFDNLMNVP